MKISIIIVDKICCICDDESHKNKNHIQFGFKKVLALQTKFIFIIVHMKIFFSAAIFYPKGIPVPLEFGGIPSP